MKTPDPKEIRRKIINALALCPVLTPSQLQIGVGTNIPPKLWRPVLNDMIAEGTICRREVELREHDYFDGKLTPFASRSTFHSVLCLTSKGTQFEVRLGEPIPVSHNHSVAA